MFRGGDRKGFTLVELLVTIVVIGVILGLGIWRFSLERERFKNEDSLRTVKNAVVYAQSRAYGSGENLTVAVKGKEVDVVNADGKVLKKYTVSQGFKGSYKIKVFKNGKITNGDVFLDSGVTPNCIHLGDKFFLGKTQNGVCKRE